MKRRTWLTIVGVAVAALLATQSVAARAMIYRLATSGQSDSYLVGTMHSEDPRVTALLADIEPLLTRVDSVALELVPDGVAMVAVGVATLLPAGERLRTLLGEHRQAGLEGAARERGLDPAMLDRLQPWAAALLIGMPTATSGRFLDAEIYLAALERGRRTVGLEQVAEQLSVFQAMPLPLQLELLDDSIKNAGSMPKQLEELTQAYLVGDAERLTAMAATQFGDMSPGVASWMQERLLVDRNRLMLERLRPLLDDGAVLIAVGAMHLGGDDGLLAGLKAMGYAVTPWPQ